MLLDFAASQILVGLQVDFARLGDHFIRKLRPRRLAVELNGIKPVADVLLVQGWRIGANGIAILGPEAGAIGRQNLVSQNKRAIVIHAKLELGVGDDNSMTEAERELITLDVDISSFAQLYVSISESDSLSYDNQFYLYGGEKPTINVLYYSTLPNNYFTSALLIVQDALRDDWNLQITEKREGDPIIEGYDLYIYEHNMPKTLPTDGVVFCVNPKSLPSSAGVKMGALAQSSSGNEVFASAGETHPIMNNINASYISITQFYTISTYDGYTPLVTVKDDPLLLVRDEPDSKIVVMPFSLHYSNLALLPEFPLLILNTVNHFFPTTVDEYVFETGDSIDLNARGPFIEVSGPGVNKTIEKLPASLEVKAPGTYTFIQYPISGTPAVESVYVRIPESESNINLIEPTLTNPYFYTDTGASNIDLLFYFALAMVALLFLEWWLKSREQI